MSVQFGASISFNPIKESLIKLDRLTHLSMQGICALNLMDGTQCERFLTTTQIV
ncbi:hypothetical protein I4U23_015837 [Adineta vaga]|nr:hypothetical protein I4U23_015837 [Adineta vaga]